MPNPIDLVRGLLQARLTSLIAADGFGSLMWCAIDFDHESKLRPVQVHLHAAIPHLDP
jgi:hypothetical protein